MLNYFLVKISVKRWHTASHEPRGPLELEVVLKTSPGKFQVSARLMPDADQESVWACIPSACVPERLSWNLVGSRRPVRRSLPSSVVS